MTKKNQLKNRQTVVDYIAKHGSVFDYRAYYNDYEDGTATSHFNTDCNSPCSLKTADQSKVKVSDWAGTDAFGDIEWYVLCEGFECQCGQMKNITLVVQGRPEEVALKAHGIDAHDLLG